MNDYAAFWVSSASEYVRQARESADYLAKEMPDVERILLAPIDVDPKKHFHRTIKGPPLKGPHWYVDSVRYFNLALETLRGEKSGLMYLDSDAYVLEPIPECFDMLKRFDIVGSISPAINTIPTIEPLPNCFGEFEIGVLLFNLNDAIADLFADWLQLYENNYDVYGPSDQGPLREAMWRAKDLRIGTMPSEYQCRWGFGVFAWHSIKVLHGRDCQWADPDNPGIEDIIGILNAHTGPRIWSPRDPLWEEGIRGWLHR